jgi:hypothetical protein
LRPHTDRQQKFFARRNKSPLSPVSSSEAAEHRNGGAIAAWRHDYIKRRIKSVEHAQCGHRRDYLCLALAVGDVGGTGPRQRKKADP